jgi:hypothetical protein
LIRQDNKNRIKVIVDEAHVIKTWGASGFRLSYLNLGQIRAFVHEQVPFAAYSATMPSETVEIVKKTLHIHPTNHELLNLGNFWANIIWDVHQLKEKTTKKSIYEIKLFLPGLTFNMGDIPLTIVFVNEHAEGQLVYNYIRDLVPTHLKSQVHFIFALKSLRGKRWILYECMIKA